jgi:hypothetical protein
MTKKLEEVFDLSSVPLDNETTELLTQADSLSKNILEINEDNTDNELDQLAKKAENSYDDLMSLGMNVEARFSAPIFEAASKMLRHAIDAKLGKAQKKLKEYELKLRAAKQAEKEIEYNPTEITASVIDRNELIKSLKNQ